MMAVMSVRIDDNKRRLLKVIASLEGKTMGGIVSDLIDDYIRKNSNKIKQIPEFPDLKGMMAMSEKAFMEWDNEEDEIYNDL